MAKQQDVTKQQIMEKATAVLAQVDNSLDMSDIDKLAVLKAAVGSLEGIMQARSMGAVIAASIRSIGQH